jgi:hypothetical protein
MHGVHNLGLPNESLPLKFQDSLPFDKNGEGITNSTVQIRRCIKRSPSLFNPRETAALRLVPSLPWGRGSILPSSPPQFDFITFSLLFVKRNLRKYQHIASLRSARYAFIWYSSLTKPLSPSLQLERWSFSWEWFVMIVRRDFFFIVSLSRFFLF